MQCYSPDTSPALGDHQKVIALHLSLAIPRLSRLVGGVDTNDWCINMPSLWRHYSCTFSCAFAAVIILKVYKKIWDWVGIQFATPGSAVRHVSEAKHVQDLLEVCLALLGSLHCSGFGCSSEWLKEHSQLTGFNPMIPLVFQKWLPSQS